MNSYIKPPCNNCPARHPLCHADCLSYAIFRAKKQIAYNQAAARDAGAYTSHSTMAHMRKNGVNKKETADVGKHQRPANERMVNSLYGS